MQRRRRPDWSKLREKNRTLEKLLFRLALFSLKLGVFAALNCSELGEAKLPLRNPALRFNGMILDSVYYYGRISLSRPTPNLTLKGGNAAGAVEIAPPNRSIVARYYNNYCMGMLVQSVIYDILATITRRNRQESRRAAQEAL